MNNKYYKGYKNYEKLFFLDIEKQRSIAKDLSEGNIFLEEFLLNCWKRKIKSFSCCRGHDKIQIPFISFILDKNSYSFANLLLNNISYEGLGISRVDICAFDTMTFSVFTKNYTDQTFFRKLNDFLCLIDFLNNPENEVLNKVSSIGIHALSSNYIMRLIVDDEKNMAIELERKPKGEKNVTLKHKIEDDLANQLDILKQSNTTNTIPIGLFLCNTDSLVELHKIIYTNISYQKKKNR